MRGKVDRFKSNKKNCEQTFCPQFYLIKFYITWISEFVGARYYFSNSFAALAEIGYDVSLIRIGVAYKF